MGSSELPEEFLKLLQTVTGRRSRIVVDHILEHGYITTEQLEEEYGYKHSPRAVADVRDQGVPIETFQTTSSTGQTIAGYRFGNPADAIRGQTGGRRNFPQKLKTELFGAQDGKCAVCDQQYDRRYLQIDHRVPYLVAGELDDEFDAEDFMLLCRSCNRAKSWSCEHCPNGSESKSVDTCLTCYWASPDDYEHIATESERRVALVWSGIETNEYDELKSRADDSIQQYIKALLKKHLQQKNV